jgi:hypothetical protein
MKNENKITARIQNLFLSSRDAADVAHKLLREMATSRPCVTYTQLGVEADLNKGTEYGDNCQRVCDYMVAEETAYSVHSSYVARMYLSKGIAVGTMLNIRMGEVFSSYVDQGSRNAGRPAVRITNMLEASSALKALADLTMVEELEAAAKADALELDDQLGTFAAMGKAECCIQDEDGDFLVEPTDAEFLQAWIGSVTPCGVCG